MGAYDGIQESLRTTMNGMGLYSIVNIGSLPADNGISMYIGAGSPDEIFLDKGSTNDLFITVNAKHLDGKKAISALSTIHEKLTRNKTYAHTNDWQIFNIETATAPNYITTYSSGQVVYGSILKVSFYLEGVN